MEIPRGARRSTLAIGIGERDGDRNPACRLTLTPLSVLCLGVVDVVEAVVVVGWLVDWLAGCRRRK